jgi:hypothetical protein
MKGEGEKQGGEASNESRDKDGIVIAAFNDFTGYEELQQPSGIRQR